jgi:hypothetical protein
MIPIKWPLVAGAALGGALIASALAAYALGQSNALDKRALVREERAFAAGQAQCAAETAAAADAAQRAADEKREAASEGRDVDPARGAWSKASAEALRAEACRWIELGLQA